MSTDSALYFPCFGVSQNNTVGVDLVDGENTLRMWLASVMEASDKFIQKIRSMIDDIIDEMSGEYQVASISLKIDHLTTEVARFVKWREHTQKQYGDITWTDLVEEPSLVLPNRVYVTVGLRDSRPISVVFSKEVVDAVFSSKQSNARLPKSVLQSISKGWISLSSKGTAGIRRANDRSDKHIVEIKTIGHHGTGRDRIYGYVRDDGVINLATFVSRSTCGIRCGPTFCSDAALLALSRFGNL